MRDSPQDVHKKVLGRRGERLALDYLKEKGYTLLESNYKTRFGEADLVLAFGNTVVFAEVKTRLSDTFGQPAEAVDARKQARYIKIAKSFLQRWRGEDINIRFDVIEVTDATIRHIEGAFEA